MAKFVDAELDNILSDNFSGSSQLLDKLNCWLRSNYKTSTLPIEILNKIQVRLNSFNNIRNYIEQLKQIAAKNNPVELVTFLNNFEEAKNERLNKLISNSYKVLKNYISFLTISNSSTIEHVLKFLRDKNNDIALTICESRPVLEGRILAEKFSDYGVRVTLVTEAMIAGAVENCDCALLGADKIFSDGSILNKVGSRLIAISCKYFNKPCYVISDKLKLAGNDKITQPRFPSTEIWDKQHANISINNYYFETIESSLITEILSE